MAHVMTKYLTLISHRFLKHNLFFLSGQPLRDSERATIRAVHNWFLTKRRTMTRTRSMQDKLRRNIDSSESPHNSNDSLHEGSVDLSNFELDTSENDFDSSQNFSQNFSVKVER